MSLDTLSHYFQSLGIHPVLGGFLIGVLLCALVRISRFKSTVVKVEPYPQPTTMAVHSANISMSVNGQPISLPPEISAQIMDHLRQGNQIEAIKLLRQSSNLDLLQSKSCVEFLQRNGTLPS